MADTHTDSFTKQHPDIEIVEVIVPDLNGRLRGKWIKPGKIATLMDGRMKLPVSTLAFDVWGRDPEAWVFDDGDADGLIIPDQDSINMVPWLSRPTAQVLCSLANADNSACDYDTRTVVANLDKEFERLGLHPVVALEMEFSLFRQSDISVPVHSQQSLSGATPLGGQTYGIDEMQDMSIVMDDIHKACAVQGLPVDTLIKEAGVSQYEINLYHQPSALAAADQAVLLQRVIRGVAKKHDLHASFMAKPFVDDAGNGMHVHCSVGDKDGKNIFANKTHEGSEELRFAIAGVLATLSDSMLMFAPHQNSYKRLQPGCHAPVTVSWGYDNRTVALRIPNDDVKALRIEHRVSGADANPYLVIAGLLTGILHGLNNKLPCDDPIEGDAAEHQLAVVPTNWRDAIRRFEKSNLIKNALGSAFQNAFALTKRQELAEFEKQISPLEYDTYL